jgi:hypothetical protein
MKQFKMRPPTITEKRTVAIGVAFVLVFLAIFFSMRQERPLTFHQRWAPAQWLEPALDLERHAK